MSNTIAAYKASSQPPKASEAPNANTTPDMCTRDAPFAGGTTLPDELIVQPLGRPDMLVTTDAPVVVRMLSVALGTQGHTVGVVAVVLGYPKPPTGALFDEADVTDGLATVLLGVSWPVLLMLPPFDLIDCHVPLVPE